MTVPRIDVEVFIDAVNAPVGSCHGIIDFLFPSKAPVAPADKSLVPVLQVMLDFFPVLKNPAIPELVVDGVADCLLAGRVETHQFFWLHQCHLLV